MVATFMSVGLLHAQDVDEGTQGGSFDPGSLLIEITGTPFEGSSLLNFGSLRARYGVTDVIVPRLGITMALSTVPRTPDVVVDNSEFELRPGCEYHLTIDGSFRSYASADFIIGSRTVNYESTTGSSVTGASSVPNGNNQFYSENVRGHFRYGIAFGAGAEYHLSSRFYIGAEIGLEFYNDKKSEILVDGELYQNSVTVGRGGINTRNAIRVGFKLF